MGNAPLLEWIASELTGHETPIAHGELVCLVRSDKSPRWRVLWALSADAEAEAEAVVTKIKSKMNTAGALGAVIVGLTTFLLQDALQKDPTVWHWASFAALGASAALYFATLFLYDTMQMPPRFWASTFPLRAQNQQWHHGVWGRLRHGWPSPRRPPSSTARVLQASMVRVWTWIFLPATVLAGVGVASLAVGASAIAGGSPVRPSPWWVVGAIVVLALGVAAWVAWHRPQLGASD